MQKIKIQGSNDKIYDVEVDGSTYDCKCSGAKKTKCAHAVKAMDFFNNKFQGHIDLLLSAFHKEVRRCDYHKGMTWAYIIKKFCSDEDVKDLYLSICIEDTRNFHLYNCILNKWKELGQIKIAEMLLTSKKSWMIKSDINPALKMIEGYLLQAGPNVFVEDKIRRTLMNSESLAEWYACVFSIFMSNDRKPLALAFVDSLKNRMASSSRIPNRQEIKFLMSVKMGFHEMLSICELANKVWDMDMMSYFPIKEEYVKPNYIPKFEEYVFDNVTWLGRERLYKKWFSVKYGKKQPEGIDLRWSGLMVGVLWRFLTHEKDKSFESLKDASWEGLSSPSDDIVDGMYRLGGFLDKMFYGTVHFIHMKLDDDPIFVQIVKDNSEHEDLVRPKAFFESKVDGSWFRVGL